MFKSTALFVEVIMDENVRLVLSEIQKMKGMSKPETAVIIKIIRLLRRHGGLFLSVLVWVLAYWEHSHQDHPYRSSSG